MKKYGRREFFTNAGMGLAGYTLLARVPAQAAQEDDIAERMKRIQHAPGAIGAPNEPNMKVVDLSCDVFVAGGGLAGVVAAISAARHGAKVVFCQDRSRLGGNASSEIKMHPNGCLPFYTGFREGGIIEELKLEGAVRNPQNSWEICDLILYEKVLAEKNITLLLDAPLFRADAEGGKIKTAWVRCDISQQIYKVSSKIFIDCTGDARLAMEAGDDLMKGREGSAKYGESNADYDTVGSLMGSSIVFCAKEFDRPMPYKAPPWALKVEPEMLRFRAVSEKNFAYGYWWIELGGDQDAIANNELLRFELLRVVTGIWDYVKNSGKYPNSANWAMDSVGMVPGRRDSWRIVPEFLFTQHGIEGDWKKFHDNVCMGGWSMDDHPKKGFYDFDKRPCRQDGRIKYYDIPFGCLMSKKLKNLMMAGRNAGVSHVALTSTRVMATCAAMGQAVGTAAAMSVKTGKLPAEIRADSALMKDLQQTLLRDDQTIHSAKNEDAKDLARAAFATASESILGSAPANVLNGVCEDHKVDMSSRKNMTRKTENRWIAPVASKPWLQLAWDSPRKISHVQLTLDTGCRALAQTAQPDYFSRMHWAAQPETLKDFKLVAILADGSRKELADVKGNYLRLLRFDFADVDAKALRLEISATNGDENAAVFEIRAYA